MLRGKMHKYKRYTEKWLCVQNYIVFPKPLSTGSYSLWYDAPNALHRRRLRTWLVVLVETHCHNTTMFTRHSYLNRWTYSILQTLPHYEDIIVSEALRHLKSHTERSLVHIRYRARASRGTDKLHYRTTALQLQDKLHAYNILQLLGALHQELALQNRITYPIYPILGIHQRFL